MRQKLKTSVIGSYPIQIDPMSLMQDYFSEKESTWVPVIDQAVRDMTNAGINLISDGQTRDPFIQLFTRKLNGCRVRDRTEIIGHVSHNGPITVSDQKYVRRLLPRKTGLIGVLTGPFTLMKSSVDLFYHDEKQLSFDFATALHHEALLLQKHVDLISIDEPFFSNELPDYAKELLKVITDGLSLPTRLHVCGDVSRIVPHIVDMPVDILSHEFKASPQLLNVFKEHPSTKHMCIGSVRSDDSRIEPVEEIIAHVKNARDVFGDKIVQIAPDCGQRLLPRQAAFLKLKNLASAGEIING